MTRYTVTIQQDEQGEAFIVMPEEIVKKYDLKDGDAVEFEARDGVLFLRFPENIEQ